MKKLMVLPILLCLLMLPGCHGQRYGILSYQEKEIYAECVLNGEYKIAINKGADQKTVSFLEPSERSSVSFTEKDGKITASASGVEIPFEKGEIEGVFAILSMFSLDEKCLVSATSTGDSACMEFTSAHGSYKITIGKNDLPKHIEILSDSYEFDIVIEAIKLN